MVRVYVDDASADADTTRSEGQDPNQGIGLIAEARTSGGTILVTLVLWDLIMIVLKQIIFT